MKMNLENIKEKLQKEGYEMISRPLYEYGNCIQGGITKENKNASLDAYFRILIIEEKMYLDFASQVFDNKYFDSEEKLIKYIKDKFTIG
jgi:hypothetical protein